MPRSLEYGRKTWVVAGGRFSAQKTKWAHHYPPLKWNASRRNGFASSATRPLLSTHTWLSYPHRICIVKIVEPMHKHSVKQAQTPFPMGSSIWNPPVACDINAGWSAAVPKQHWCITGRTQQVMLLVSRRQSLMFASVGTRAYHVLSPPSDSSFKSYSNNIWPMLLFPDAFLRKNRTILPAAQEGNDEQSRRCRLRGIFRSPRWLQEV